MNHVHEDTWILRNDMSLLTFVLYYSAHHRACTYPWHYRAARSNQSEQVHRFRSPLPFNYTTEHVLHLSIHQI